MNDALCESGVFGRTLEAASAANRFRDPSLPPGECAGRLEGRVLDLEQRLFTQLASAFTRAFLVASERERVVATVVAWSLDSRADMSGLLAEVDAMLKSFEACEAERLQILIGIARVLSGAQSRDAA